MSVISRGADWDFELLERYDTAIAEIAADFRLEITDHKFDLGFKGTLKLGGFGSFDVQGGAVIDKSGFAAYGKLHIDLSLVSVLTIGGDAELKINTATSGSPVTITIPGATPLEIAAGLVLQEIRHERGRPIVNVQNLQCWRQSACEGCEVSGSDCFSRSR